MIENIFFTYLNSSLHILQKFLVLQCQNDMFCLAFPVITAENT